MLQELTGNQSKTQANNFLDLFASFLISSKQMKASIIISAMRSRIKHDEAQLSTLENKQAELSAAFNQYMDVQARIKSHEKSIEKIVGMVDPYLYGFDSEVPPTSQQDYDQRERARECRKNLQLWEAIEQYLRFNPERESKVKDIVEFLDVLCFECSRQSIEAAIKAHPKVFKIHKRKNEKFISLKGE